jgi:hypothetical protein
MRIQLKKWIILGCVMLSITAFYYGYYITFNKYKIEKPLDTKGGIIGDTGSSTFNKIDDIEALPPKTKKVAKDTMLIRKVISINTDNLKVEYEGYIPDFLVNCTEEQIIDYYNDLGKVEFIGNTIYVTRECPYMPNCYVVKLDGDYIKAYKTDLNGNAEEFTEFTPELCRNKDGQLEKGIEVENPDDIYRVIQDYD